MQLNKTRVLALACALGTALTGCGGNNPLAVTSAPKNIIFFLGDGMGMTTLTAARIYAVGEDGDLTIDKLPETAFIKTYSNDAQVTDSAPSMSAYMTGVKMNNEVIAMTTDTLAIAPTANKTSNCGVNNGSSVPSLLEIAKAYGLSTGVVTTTRITHATPAATYAHVCHRDAENDIASQLVPNGTGYNNALGNGVDVILGGGTDYFVPTADGGKRTDGRHLITEISALNYTVVNSGSDLSALDATKTPRLFGLFNKDHLNFDLDRVKNVINEPSLADMTTKAMDVLAQNKRGFFLMVEGGRIDHALHQTNAKRALQDTKAFDDAIKVALDKANVMDPGLQNTLIVVTADHDHTLVLNGYAKRKGKTTDSNPGVLGLVHNYITDALDLDSDSRPYTIIGFGNGENRFVGDRSGMSALTDAAVSADDYHQEAVVPTATGSETHGGTDVFLAATGKGADSFHGVLENTAVFQLIRNAAGL